jgi:hypothetical protein
VRLKKNCAPAEKKLNVVNEVPFFEALFFKMPVFFKVPFFEAPVLFKELFFKVPFLKCLSFFKVSSFSMCLSL